MWDSPFSCLHKKLFDSPDWGYIFNMNIMIGIIVFILGIVIGSFLNVCIYRMPAGKSIAYGPSSCQSCGKSLSPVDLVPVFSWLFLGGKCRYCKARVSAQYPAIELLTGVLFLLLYLKLGISWCLLIYAALTALLIVISMIDLKHMMIPDGLIIAGLVVGAAKLIATIPTGYFGSWIDYVIGFFAGGLPLLLIAAFCAYVLKKEAIGGGDIKLMAMAGLITGWKLIAVAYLIGIVAGALISIILMATKIKKHGDEIPFGPFLSLGIIISIFFGTELIGWYMGLL